MILYIRLENIEIFLLFNNSSYLRFSKNKELQMRILPLFLLIVPFSTVCSDYIYSDAIVKKIDIRQKPGNWILEKQKEVAYHYYGDQDAKAEYQELGKEAQNLLGIPKEDQVSIKKMAPHAPNFAYAPACMCNGYIFVKEEFMDRTWFGIKRVSLIHEAVHKKQFRPFEQQVVILNPSKYSKFEQEADFEGAYRGNCYRCTYEFFTQTTSRKRHESSRTKSKRNGIRHLRTTGSSFATTTKA